MPEQLSTLQILLEDGPVIAVNKTAGLLTQGVPRGIPTLEAQVKDFLKERFSKPGNVYLGIPHRLDRPVSGVVVFARNSKAARRLAEQFQQRQVRKVYWAIVEQPPDPPQGKLNDWLLKIKDESRCEVAPAGSPSARECSLTYRTLAVDSGRAILEIEPQTGRMHQIRIQLANRGWFVVGDSLYGARTTLRPESAADPRAEPIALHARSLTFLHPIRYDPVTVVAPIPDFWQPFSGLLCATQSM